MPPRTRVRPEIGTRFGRLTVVAHVEGSGSSWEVCKCDCGTVKEMRAWSLLHYKAQSCGCLRTPEPLQAFWRHVTQSGCWLWGGALTNDGYGSFLNDLAHRWAYTAFVGPIPEDLQLDHLCRVRNCVNPDHLEPVTSHENTIRGERSNQYRGKTHCPKGHEYTEENTLAWTNENGRPRRRCRTCLAASRTRRAATHREKRKI